MASRRGTPGGLSISRLSPLRLLRWVESFWSGAPTPNPIAPLLTYADGHEHSAQIERFGDYVVRQLGIPICHGSSPALAKAAEDYLMGNKSQADTSRENLLALVTSACAMVSDDHVAHLTHELLAELDACMLTYFSFHWKHAGLVIDQIIHGPKRKHTLKDVVYAATRELRFKRVLKHLGSQQKLCSLVEEMRLLSHKDREALARPTLGEVLVPANDSVRSPVLLLIGGGMGAGKSTAVHEVMQTPFWSKVAHNAVVVEADAFKEKDVVYRALLASEKDGGDVAQIAQLVHEASTKAASSIVVTAMNEGRDVIFDGTMSWEPFVMQTIAMARDVHLRRYRLGPGYEKKEDGSVTEFYWEPMGEEEVGGNDEGESEKIKAAVGNRSMGRLKDGPRLPYRVEVVGVVCDAHLAVMRGMRRAILTGRGVPVAAQLRSHQLFASSLERYCAAVDKALVYCTDGIGTPPLLMAYKEGNSKLLVDVTSYSELSALTNINVKADNALELYKAEELSPSTSAWNRIARWLFLNGGRAYTQGSSWKNVVQAECRRKRQEALKEAMLMLQACAMRPASAIKSDSSNHSTSLRKRLTS
eukprot:TRINITY_DN3704_c0_g6_i1.p1 TRINITY_DN3704_c0_g6~~TRINITY_DN3704_c0_g6_i1.p1  ORF type:complete len:587 (+),score=94.36 TRINITY_DN3704_c0_g6_i1:473-2233(+)